jgi:hypothetical protein
MDCFLHADTDFKVMKTSTLYFLVNIHAKWLLKLNLNITPNIQQTF